MLASGFNRLLQGKFDDDNVCQTYGFELRSLAQSV